MKLLKNAALTVLALAFCAGSALADASLSKVKEKGELVVGLCAAYPPFESRNEKNGTLEGFDIDFATELAARLGVKVRITDTEWPGLIAGINKGDFDVVISCMSKSETKGNNVSMTDVYYELHDVIVVRQEDNAISAESDLKGKNIGVQSGSSAEQILDGLKGMSIQRYNYNPEAFQDLKSKRIDAVVVGYAYAVNQMKEAPGVFRVVVSLGAKSEIVVIAKEGSTALTAELNKALKELKASGRLGALEKKWLSVE